MFTFVRVFAVYVGRCFDKLTSVLPIDTCLYVGGLFYSFSIGIRYAFVGSFHPSLLCRGQPILSEVGEAKGKKKRSGGLDGDISGTRRLNLPDLKL